MSAGDSADVLLIAPIDPAVRSGWHHPSSASSGWHIHPAWCCIHATHSLVTASLSPCESSRGLWKKQNKIKKTFRFSKISKSVTQTQSRTTTVTVARRLSLNFSSRQKVCLSSDAKDSRTQSSWFWVKRSGDAIKLFFFAVASMQIKSWFSGLLILWLWIIIHLLTSNRNSRA